MYICYNDGNGNWTSPINLGKEINSLQLDYCPFIDLKSGKLYFTSKRTTVKDHFDSNQKLEKLLEEMHKYENGQSRLYQVNLKDIDQWNPIRK